MTQPSVRPSRTLDEAAEWPIGEITKTFEARMPRQNKQMKRRWCSVNVQLEVKVAGFRVRPDHSRTGFRLRPVRSKYVGARLKRREKQVATPPDDNLGKLVATATVEEENARLKKGGTEVDKSSGARRATTSRGTTTLLDDDLTKLQGLEQHETSDQLGKGPKVDWNWQDLARTLARACPYAECSGSRGGEPHTNARRGRSSYLQKEERLSRWSTAEPVPKLRRRAS